MLADDYCIVVMLWCGSLAGGAGFLPWHKRENEVYLIPDKSNGTVICQSNIKRIFYIFPSEI